MVKTAGPLFGPNVSGPIRRRVRRKYPPPPPMLTVHVTAGTPAPNPDCTGTYVHIDEHGGEHVYRRTTAPLFLIYWDAGFSSWTIDLEIIDSNGTDCWFNGATIEGDYEPQNEYTGFPTASVPAME